MLKLVIASVQAYTKTLDVMLKNKSVQQDEFVAQKWLNSVGRL